VIDTLSRMLSNTEFGWLDVLDILMVAFIIYQLLLFIRGTHAVQMALGGGVLVLLYWTSRWADLQTVNWLLRTFLPYVVFGIIVVFQTEIRKVLAHLGKTPLLGAFSSQKTGSWRCSRKGTRAAISKRKPRLWRTTRGSSSV